MEMALHQLVVRVEKALDQQDTFLGVFLDIGGAFNNTSCVLLLLNMGLRWIRATLDGRLATATLGGSSKSVEVSRGCPQGDVLSPLLWCVVVDKLIAGLKRGGVHTEGYAGDICLPAVGKFPNPVSELIKWAHYFCILGMVALLPDG